MDNRSNKNLKEIKDIIKIKVFLSGKSNFLNLELSGSELVENLKTKICDKYNLKEKETKLYFNNTAVENIKDKTIESVSRNNELLLVLLTKAQILTSNNNNSNTTN